MVIVDSDKCVGCGVCETVCPVGVFSVVNGKSSASSERCISCRNCEASCPAGCIIIGKVTEAWGV